VYNEHLPVWFPRLPLLLASCTLSTTSLLAQSSSKRCLSRSASYLALSPPELYCSTYHPLNPAAGFPRLFRFYLMMFFFSFCATSVLRRCGGYRWDTCAQPPPPLSAPPPSPTEAFRLHRRCIPRLLLQCHLLLRPTSPGGRSAGVTPSSRAGSLR